MNAPRLQVAVLAAATVLSLHGAWARAADVAAASGAGAQGASAPAVAASAASTVQAPSAASGTAVVEQPRSFGHVIGDVLTQRVRLDHAGRAVEPATLPPADRVGLFLERRTPRVEHDAQGRRWLVIDYQVINAPRTLSTAALPALSITTTSGTTLPVASWPISIGPLTPEAAFGQGELLPMRPERPVDPLPTAGIERQLKAALIALAAVLSGWAAWWGWRNHREGQGLPFARAWQQLRRLDEASPAAWLALHQAINASAGRAVQGATLPRLLAEAPHLQPLQAQLVAFFEHSSARFFAVQAPGSSAPASFPLRALARALREAERRHHA